MSTGRTAAVWQNEVEVGEALTIRRRTADTIISAACIACQGTTGVVMSIEDPIVGLDAAVQPAAAAAGPRSRRTLKIATAVVGSLLVIGGFAVWRFVSGFGSATDSASAIPADADFYVNLDLATFLDREQMQQIARTFPDLVNDAEASGDILAELDRRLDDELGITFSHDISPWLGRSAAIAGWGFDVQIGEPEHVLFVVTVRDGDAADQTLERIALAGGGGTIGFHEEVAIWEITLEGEARYAARADDVLLIGESSESVDVGIETTLGLTDSLQQNPNFIESLASLPEGPGNVMVYAAGSLWDQISERSLYTLGASTPFTDMGQLESVIAAFALSDDGVRIDGSAAMDPELASFYMNDRIDEAIKFVPTDAMFLLAADYEPVMDSYRELLGAPDAMEAADWESELGFNPITEGLDLLDGRFTVYGVPGRTPAVDGGFDLGVAGVLGLTDPTRMNATLDKIEDLITNDGSGVERVGDLRYIDVFGGPEVAFGVTGDRLTLAWNTDPTADAAGARVTENTRYRQLADSLGGDLSLFVDIPTVVDAFGGAMDTEPAGAFAAIGGVGATWTSTDEGIVTGSMMVLIDWAG